MSGYAMFVRGNPALVFGAHNLSHYAYAMKAIGSHAEDVWLTSKVAFTDNIPGVSGLSGWLQAFTCDGSYLANHPVMLNGVQMEDGWATLVQSNLDRASTPVPVAHKWFTLESHVQQNTSRGSWISCEHDFERTDAVANLPATRIHVGCFSEVSDITGLNLNEVFEMYVAHVRVGTTRGGKDIFEDDFASGDFSAWDSHTAWGGTYGATIVGNPGFPPFDSGCEARAFGEGGAHLAPIRVPLGNVEVKL